MRRILIALACLAVAPSIAARQAQSAQQPLVFRSAAALVPIDVRVLDRQGHPVTNLTARDFIVRENGVAQQIQQFVPLQLAPGPVPITASSVLDAGSDATPAAQSRRVFLIVLGRGRLQEPAKGLDASARFVRDRLLPQDQVSICAYNRATDFTVNHEQAAQIIDRFKASNDLIESKLVHYLMFPGADTEHFPAEIQRLIDGLFAGPGMPSIRTMRPNERARQTMNTDGVASRLTDATGLRLADMESTSFGNRISRSRQTMFDLARLYAGIDYLRYIPGEKHLLFVYERSLYLRSTEDDERLAASANDARVAINSIQTGGLAPAALPTSVPRSLAGLTRGASLTDMLALQTQRTLAELTGGQASIQTYADKGFSLIDDTTRSGYLLGYSPTNRAVDGTYREINITVSRPDTRVVYRHGYHAFERGAVVAHDRASITYNRMVVASVQGEDLTDIGVKASAKVAPSSGGPSAKQTVEVVLTIQAAGKLDVAMFAGDARERLLGETWQQTELTAVGQSINLQLPVNSRPKYIKVVVYDYATDRTGSVVAKIG